MIQLPQLQDALIAASDGMVLRSRRRARRFRLGLMTGAAVVGIGGAAVAGSGLLDSVVGRDGAGPATVSAAGTPTSQTDRIAALRRPQTGRDRGPVAQAAVASLGGAYRGVRTGDVRVLGPADAAEPVVLVPVETVTERSTSGTATVIHDALCLVVPDAAGAQTTCSSAADAFDGRAIAVSDRYGSGLVPDGVQTVRVTTPPSRTAVSVPVDDNVYAVRTSLLGPASTVSWLDGQGAAIPFPGGGTTRPLAGPTTTSALPAGLKDCGRAQGGVVPDRISCGAQARSYVPKPGEAYRSTKP